VRGLVGCLDGERGALALSGVATGSEEIEEVADKEEEDDIEAA